jgi:glyoxylase-like metal-dependent hydrolase (beta-lactamase superfamily II)
MQTEIHPIPLGFDTCYVLRGDGVVVLDAGQPNRLSAFRRGLAKAGIMEGEVDLILLTHAHWDHMGSAADIRGSTGARLAVHEAEAEWVETGRPDLPSGFTLWGRTFMPVVQLLASFITVHPSSVDIRLDDEPRSLEEFGIAGTVVHTPGHSPGSVSVVLETGEAFVGDLAMNRFPLTLAPGLPILGDDMSAVVSSWHKLLGMGVKTIFPAHGASFPVNVIRRALERIDS